MKSFICLLAVICLHFTSSADVVHCETGDQLRGKVLSVSETEVKLQSHIAGDLTIPREKVLSITFERKGTTGIRAIPSRTAGAKTNSASAPLEEALKNIDPQEVAKVQQDILATATPEAQEMFRETLQGLMSGKINLQDIRVQAQDALNQLDELSKDLGDDEISGLIGTYGTILQNFLKQTGGAATNKPSVKTNTPPAQVEDEK